MKYSEQEYLDIKHNPEKYNRQIIIDHNKELIDAYPWLSYNLIENDDGTFVIDYDKEDFLWTWLDSLDDGWRISFGINLCNELKEELERFNYINKYQIIDIKEKYGVLRWYDRGYPKESEVEAIIDKYVRLSEQVCMDCGNPVKWKLDDPYWIYYYCDDCKNKLEESGTDLKFIRIE